MEAKCLHFFMDKIEGDFKGKDILSIDQLSVKSLSKLFHTTDKIIRMLKKKKHFKVLSGKIITLLFFEPSSRTFGSFASAVKRLGGQTIEVQDVGHNSSVVKGESLSDTIKVFESYSDAIVIRHPEKGSAQKAALAATAVPIINAGDGTGEHPTQAILDLYTIYQKFKRLDNLTGLIAGDLLNGRTVHSLIKGLSLYKKNALYLLSPKSLGLPTELINNLAKKIRLVEIEKEADIPTDLYFWYWTRVQKERFKNIGEYEKVKNRFVITPELVIKKGNQHMIIMHPLPRVGEIDPRVDDDKRAVYLKLQVPNGVYTRMALLTLILSRL